MKVICSSEESLYRVEATRWRERMELLKPIGDVVVIIPCSMRKPYSNSKSHQVFKRSTKGFQELILTSPFGICPREMEYTYPIQSYDVAVTGSWSYEEKKVAGELLQKYVAGKTVIANVSGGYEETCREYLGDSLDKDSMAKNSNCDCYYACEDGRPTSSDSMYNLRELLQKYDKVRAKDRKLHELRSIATYQFGKGAENLISDNVISKGRYHRNIYENSKQLALLNRDTGLFSLNLEGGKKIAELGLKTIEIDFELVTNSLFAPGVLKADNNIIPKDEVVITRNGELVGVGRAVMAGNEMEQSTKGIAVKIRHRVKK
ncbi:MAG: DUF5591 domain-containing protein [Methanobacteriaceae archaeon]